MIRRLLVLLGVLWAAPVSAATYYMATTGNDAVSCAQAQSIATPKRTFSSATGCLSGTNDTLLVRGGTYNDRIANPTIAGSSWSSYITIAAYPGSCTTNTCETVILRPTSGSAYILDLFSAQQYILFDGINYDASGGMTMETAIHIEAWASGNPHHIRVWNSDITIGSDGITGEGTGSNAFGVLLVDDKVGGATGGHEFYNLGIHDGGDTGDLTYCFYIQSKHITLDYINCYNTRGIGIQIYNANAGGAPDDIILKRVRVHGVSEVSGFDTVGILVAGTNVQLINCITHAITDAGNNGFGLLMYSGNANGTLIYNNDIYDVDGTAIRLDTSSSNTTIKNTIAFGNSTNTISDGSSGGTVTATNLIGTDPQWIDPGSSNFNIPSGSPARNAGTTLAAVTVDFEGNGRPQGASYDIGAYEYLEATSTVSRALLLFGSD